MLCEHFVRVSDLAIRSRLSEFIDTHGHVFRSSEIKNPVSILAKLIIVYAFRKLCVEPSTKEGASLLIDHTSTF